MSVCRDTKNELAKIRTQTGCCQRAEVYGLLLFSRLYDGTVLRTAYENAARRIAETVAGYCSVYVETAFPGRNDGRKLCSVAVPYEDQRLAVLNKFEEEFANSPEGISCLPLEKDCCKAAFLRGAFLSAGTLSDPEKECRVEICARSETLCRDLVALIEKLGCKCTMYSRRSEYFAYIKDGESAEKLLAVMGATKASMEIMGGRIVRDIRNNVNRQRNCDTANIGKTVAAAKVQIEAIEKIDGKKGLASLPPELYELALMRRENPGMSLEELGKSLSVPVSKSGVNHRLKKLVEMASELENEK